MTEALPTVSFAEFLRLETGEDRRHEFVGGRVWNMAGGSERHLSRRYGGVRPGGGPALRGRPDPGGGGSLAVDDFYDRIDATATT